MSGDELGTLGRGKRFPSVRSLTHSLDSVTSLTHIPLPTPLPPHPPSQADLESIRSHLLQRKGTLVNLTGDERALSAAAAHVNDLLGRLPESAASSSGSGSSWQQQGLLPRVNEALVVPTQVRGGRHTHTHTGGALGEGSLLSRC